MGSSIVPAPRKWELELSSCILFRRLTEALHTLTCLPRWKLSALAQLNLQEAISSMENIISAAIVSQSGCSSSRIWIFVRKAADLQSCAKRCHILLLSDSSHASHWDVFSSIRQAAKNTMAAAGVPSVAEEA